MMGRVPLTTMHHHPRPDVNEPNVPTTAQSEKVKTDAKGNVTITNPMVSDAIKAAKMMRKSMVIRKMVLRWKSLWRLIRSWTVYKSR